MSLREYDADQVSITWGGVLIDSGFADGEFASVEANNNAFNLVIGTDGEGTRSKSNDRSAKISIKLMQSSATNDYFSEMHNNDLASPGGAGVAALIIRDLQGTTVFSCAHAWIVKPPNQPFDRSPKSRDWPFETEKADIFVGGNLVIA